MSGRGLAGIGLVAMALAGAALAQTNAPETGGATLQDARDLMSKWIELQQVMARERKDWQQGKEIVAARVELSRKELDALDEQTRAAQAQLAEATQKRDELEKERQRLKDVAAGLTATIAGLEVRTRQLYDRAPAYIQERLKPLRQRLPDDPATTRVSVAERYQNVLGILNDLNKANSEIAINQEVHTLADGKPSEVRALYVGLAQAYFINPRGQAGVGVPGTNGWAWTDAADAAEEILLALEVMEGKHTPMFVPLPVHLQ